MICERCYDTGAYEPLPDLPGLVFVCETCGGCGITYCCEGDRCESSDDGGSDAA
jgi:hypothetical protein